MSETEVITYVEKLARLRKEHEKWRKGECINLIASENLASEDALSYLSTDFSNRYSARDRFYRGTRFTDEVESLAVELTKKLFRAKFADVRPLSGHTCSIVAFFALLKSGDKMMMCPPEWGGYSGASHEGLGKLLGLKNLYFPFDGRRMNIVSSSARKVINLKRPELVLFGASYILFPHPIRECLPQQFDGIVGYDGSHVMGLIAGQSFQQPLEEGAHFLMGSTHKTLFGPQGGLIVSNDEGVFQRLEEVLYPGIVDNIHWNRVAALAFAEIELLKFGGRYSSQVIRNAQALAKALFDQGVKVKCSEQGFTKSHQVILGYDAKASRRLADSFERVGIITDVVIRLGTSEVTRKGMREQEMEKIADIIAGVVKKKVSAQVSLKQVRKMATEFQRTEFTILN
jgi:glycine hydroxymethyltransferase